MDELDDVNNHESGFIDNGGDEQVIPELSQAAAISLGGAVEGVRRAVKRANKSKETSKREKLARLGEKGVRLNWWSQARFEYESQHQLDRSDSSAHSSDSESSSKWTESTKMTSGKVSTTKAKAKTATLKVLPLDSLMDEKDQLWKNPRRSKHFNERLGHLTWPKYEGDRRVDKLSVVQWATEVSAMLFWDVGVPVEDALFLLRRCFPENSRAKDWHTEFLNKHVSPTFDLFMCGFIPAFTDPGQAADDRADLLVLKQHSLAFWDFASKHRALWRKVNPDTTEEEMIRNWECRLNDQSRDIFQEYLVKLKSDNKLPSYSHAVDHMERKMKRKNARVQDTIFTINASFPAAPVAPPVAPSYSTCNTVFTVTDTQGEEWVACLKGCKAKKHRPGQLCPATYRDCNVCGRQGHFRSSILCPKFGAKKDIRAGKAALQGGPGTGANGVL